MSDVVVAIGLVKAPGEGPGVRGITLTVGPGECLVVLGRPGAGTSTLIDLLRGEIEPDSGVVCILGETPSQLPPSSQGRVGGVAELRRASLMSGPRSETGSPGSRSRRTVMEAFQDLGDPVAGVPWCAEAQPSERPRLVLVPAPSAGPEVLLLDEPTTTLGPEARHRVWETLNEAKRGGTAVVVATPFIDEAEAVADRFLVLDRGMPVAARAIESLRETVEARPSPA